MNKLFIKIITSLSVLFIIWLLIIGFKNSWNLQNVRFSLRQTMEYLENLNTENFENMLNTIKNNFIAYEITMKVNEGQWYSGLVSATMTTGIITVIGGALLQYLVGILQLIGSIIGFIFNPITY